MKNITTIPSKDVAYVRENHRPECAYIITNQEQLNKLNTLLGINETCYPALYVSLAGLFHPEALCREREYAAIGYEILTINEED